MDEIIAKLEERRAALQAYDPAILIAKRMGFDAAVKVFRNHQPAPDWADKALKAHEERWGKFTKACLAALPTTPDAAMVERVAMAIDPLAFENAKLVIPVDDFHGKIRSKVKNSAVRIRRARAAATAAIAALHQPAPKETTDE